MDCTGQPDAVTKMAKLGQLYAALDRARIAAEGGPPSGHRRASVEAAQLRQQIAALRAALPKPKLVVSNA